MKIILGIILIIMSSCSEDKKNLNSLTKPVEVQKKKETEKKESDLVVLKGQERNGSFPNAAKIFLNKVQKDLSSRLDILNMIEILDNKELQKRLKEYPLGPRHIEVDQVDISFVKTIIEDLRFDNRHNQNDENRIFNYGKDSEGMFIRVTDNFLNQYNSYSEQYAPVEVVKEIQRMIIHETSHLWGFQEKEALSFSKNIVDLIYHYTKNHELNIDEDLLKKVDKYDFKKFKLKRMINISISDSYRRLFDKKKSVDHTIRSLPTARCLVKRLDKETLNIRNLIEKIAKQRSENELKFLKLKFQIEYFEEDFILKISDDLGDINYFYCSKNFSDLENRERQNTIFLNGKLSLYKLIQDSYFIPLTLKEFKKRLHTDFDFIVSFYKKAIEEIQKKYEIMIQSNPKAFKEFSDCNNKTFGKSCNKLINKFLAPWEKGNQLYAVTTRKIVGLGTYYQNEKAGRKKLVDKVLGFYVFNLIKYQGLKIDYNKDKLDKCDSYKNIRKTTLCLISMLKEYIENLNQKIIVGIEDFDLVVFEYKSLIRHYAE